jgi:hypothetical protein
VSGTAALAAVAAYGTLWIHLRTANPIELRNGGGKLIERAVADAGQRTA